MTYHLRCPQLPLAIYREVAAHLSLVTGVKTELIAQQSTHFDYSLSQVDSLRIDYPEDLNSAAQRQIEQILAYYSDRYGAWETIQP